MHASHSYLVPMIIILPVWATRELEKNENLFSKSGLTFLGQ